MKLIIPYKLEFANVVASFIEEVGASYDADDDEKRELKLIGEEAFSLIMGGIPDREFTEMFHLHCMEMEDKISFQFSNHGRPIAIGVYLFLGAYPRIRELLENREVQSMPREPVTYGG